MFTISAFADEISPDPEQQVNVLEKCGVRHIELRSILKTNVLDLTDLQIQELKKLLDRRGFKLSAIGSPIGKVKIDQPFEPHLQRFKRAIELCGVFGTQNIRIFSYYLPDGSSWSQWRQEVITRLKTQTELAEKASVRLVHENEHAIYGDDPERVVDLFRTIESPSFRAVYDPANYVVDGFEPWQAWEMTREYTVHFHIKDWIHGENHGIIAGLGQGKIPDVLKDAVARKYSGFATLEPHLLGGGPTGGVTGPDLFPKAAAALQEILTKVGASYQ
jgi:sugar phosphate isomerase/epimerase